MATIIPLITGIVGALDEVIIKRILEHGNRLHATQENKTECTKLIESYKTFAEGIHHYQSAIQAALSSDEFLSTLDKQELKRLLTSLNNIIIDAQSKLPELQPRLEQVISTPETVSATQTQNTNHPDQNKKDFNWWWKRKRIVPQATIHAYRDQETIKQLNQHLKDAETMLKEGSELIQNKFGIFKVHFKQYFRGNDIYLDYANGQQEEASHEAKLKHALLHPFNVGSSTQHVSIPRTICVEGQGGMGKTTILKDICNQEDIQKEFPDGIHFMAIGQGGGDEQVMKEISKCLRNSGFGIVAEKMKDEESVEDAAVKVSKIMEGKRVMIVVDDFHPDHVRYLKNFQNMLCESQNGLLLVSSRYKQISSKCGKILLFKELKPMGNDSRKILLKHLGDERINERSGNEIKEAINIILRTCGGIKLCLATAGSSIRLRRCGRGEGGCDEDVIKKYAKDLERNCDQLVTKAGGEDMRTFLNVLVTSLGYCNGVIQVSRHKDVKGKIAGDVEASYLFKGLCVFERQQKVPIEAVSRLWDIDKHDTLQIILTLSNYSILSVDESEQWIEVHDKVVDVARYLAEADGEGGLREWHERILKGYIRSLRGGICDQEEDRENERENEGYEIGWEMLSCPRTWELDAGEDYFIENVCRHLAEGGRIEELWNLVTNVWWTLRRRESGGLVGIISDFNRLKSLCERGKATTKMGKVFNRRERVGMDILMNHIRDVWMEILDDKHMIGFEMFGRVSIEERRYRVVERYLKSIEEEGPRPWLRPMTAGLRSMDGRQINNIFTKNGIEYGSCVSADCKFIVCKSSTGFEMLDIETLQRWWTAVGEGHTLRCTSMCSKTMRVACGFEDGNVIVWDVERAEQVGMPLTGHHGWVLCVEMSEDGSRVVSGGDDGSVRVWDVERGDHVGQVLVGHHGMIVGCVGISEDGNRVVSGGTDGNIRVWDVEKGEQVGQALTGHNGVVWCVGMSKDGNRVVSGGEDGSVRIWDVERGAQIGKSFTGHYGEVLWVGVNKDGNRVVSGGGDGSVRVWDTYRAEQVGNALTGHYGTVWCAGTSRDGSRVVSGGEDGSVRVWDVERGDQVETGLTAHDGWVLCVGMKKDGNRVISGGYDGSLRIWDVARGEQVGTALTGHEGRVLCVEMSEDGTRIVSGGTDGSVRVWDVESREEVRQAFTRQYGWVVCVGLSKSGNRVVSGGDDGSVRIWDVERGEQIGEALVGHEGWVRYVRMSKDGKRVVSGGDDGSVRVWDAERGKQIGKALTGHRGMVWCVEMSQDGKRIVSGGRDGSVRVWDAIKGLQLGGSFQWQELVNTVEEVEICQLYEKWLNKVRFSIAEQNGVDEQIMCMRSLHKDVYAVLQKLGMSWISTPVRCDCNECELEDENGLLVGNEPSIMRVQEGGGIFVNDPNLNKVGKVGTAWCMKDCQTVAIGLRNGRVMICHLEL